MPRHMSRVSALLEIEPLLCVPRMLRGGVGAPRGVRNGDINDLCGR